MRRTVFEMLMETSMLLPQAFAASGGGFPMRSAEIGLARALRVHRARRDELFQILGFANGTLRRRR